MKSHTTKQWFQSQNPAVTSNLTWRSKDAKLRLLSSICHGIYGWLKATVLPSYNTMCPPKSAEVYTAKRDTPQLENLHCKMCWFTKLFYPVYMSAIRIGKAHQGKWDLTSKSLLYTCGLNIGGFFWQFSHHKCIFLFPFHVLLVADHYFLH